ncbi:MAG: GNAT family N-acetyltransferase, partial [Bdellovibrionota bacterium]
MPSAIALVPAKSEDISTLLEMVREYHTYDHLDFDPDLTGSLLKEFIANNSLGRLWMIRESDQSIGYLLLTFGFSLEYKGRDAFIDEFFLNERWRGRGLGK